MSGPARPRVSLTMIVRDGAATLGQALASCAGLVDEMIVVDTGSTDATAAIAGDLGACVLNHAWSDSFAAARNVSLRAARGEWIFWLDADEHLDPANQDRFRQLCESLDGSNRIYFFEQSSATSDGRGRIAVSQPRLFRNGPEIVWRYRVHEQILPACLARGDLPSASDVVIEHSGYVDLPLTLAKEERNRRLLECERAEHPDDPWILFQLGRVYPPERSADAVPLFERALANLPERDPLVRPIAAARVRALGQAAPAGVARHVAEAELERFPNDSVILFTVGTLAYQQGDLAAAARAFESLITRRADPDEWFDGVDPALRGAQSRHNLAVVRLREGNHAAAAALWSEVLETHPENAQAWLGLGQLLLAQGQWDELARSLDAAEAHASPAERDDVATLRAQVHLARHEFAPAIALLHDLAQRQPENIVPRLLLARAWLLEGDDLDAAEKALRDVLTLDPAHAEARRCLAALTDSTV